MEDVSLSVDETSPKLQSASTKKRTASPKKKMGKSAKSEGESESEGSPTKSSRGSSRRISRSTARAKTIPPELQDTADTQLAAETPPQKSLRSKVTKKQPRRSAKPEEPAEELKLLLEDSTPHVEAGIADISLQDPHSSGETHTIEQKDEPESLQLITPDEGLTVSTVEQQDSAPEKENETGENPRRKSRRGRRGGRGRVRKNRQASTEAGPSTSAEEPTIESEGELSDFSEYTDRSDAIPEENTESKSEKNIGKSRIKTKVSQANKKMFISVLPGEQVEVALTEEGVLLEYYLDMLHQRKIKGNIYKGIIHNIDTNLQAAFVSYGTGKNGFLQIDEIHPEYWQAHHEPAKGKKFPPIQKVLKTGQEVLVQVVKEPTGNKGAFLTTWLSMAGRFLVLTPGQEQIGVSRKVENEEERTRLREMINGIEPGQGLGVIVRTVSAGTTKTTLKNDLQYLKRLWRDIRKKATESTAPMLIHQEPGLSERAVRDYLTEDVGEIWVDNETVAETVRATVNLLFPRKKDLVRLYTDARQSMWERFGLRRQMEQIYAREVILPSGGRLVFDQTEALMAIDINSGKISGKGNFEAMSFKTNMEATEAIAHQLRLRDVGGQVVIDFIEMRDRKHIADVEKNLRQAMKSDRARHDIGHMSNFGLLELVRQRTGSSALSISTEPCPACCGTGQRRNLEWQALQSLRELRRLLRTHHGEKCIFETTSELGLYLLNHKRDTLRDMEQEFGKCLEIAIKP